jgi:hypothetical protein
VVTVASSGTPSSPAGDTGTPSGLPSAAKLPKPFVCAYLCKYSVTSPFSSVPLMCKYSLYQRIEQCDRIIQFNLSSQVLFQTSFLRPRHFQILRTPSASETLDLGRGMSIGYHTQTRYSVPEVSKSSATLS